MSRLILESAAYLNPVYPRDFPDPFVLKYVGQYWAYCTGIRADGRAFGILHSRDLVHWQEVGSALDLLPGGHTCYWAPEVTYDNGRFYMYYSVGDETTMQIRVAVAESPGGPFIDSGHGLTAEPFAIDPHVFEDDDGVRYLFYATDFLSHTHIGTGTVRDRLLDPFTLAGQPQPVTRARYDWQVYDPNRAEKGGVRWHTVEGPFVLKRKGVYYQMFSGGNWKNVTYGVSFATTRQIAAPREWEQVCDGEQVLPILRTLPGRVVGPGHNSAVRGPDNQQLMCVYHRWPANESSGSGRQLAIDPLDWAGDRMIVLGPSHTPQPAPLRPTIADFGNLGHPWQSLGGQWQADGDTAVQTALEGAAELRYPVGVASFVLEVSLRALDGENDHAAAFGIGLHDAAGERLRWRLWPARGEAAVSWETANGRQETLMPLPAGFDPRAYHLLRLEVDGRRVYLSLDEKRLRWHGRLVVEPISLTLNTESMSAAFAGFAITIGWQDLFTGESDDPADFGWQASGAGWQLQEQQLWYTGSPQPGRLVKGPLLDSYELVVNARLDTAIRGGYGFYPALTADGVGPLLRLDQAETGWALAWHDGDGGRTIWPLPTAFDPSVYQQFRCRKVGERLAVFYEGQWLGEGQVSSRPARVGLYGGQPGVAFDMVRVTAVRL